MILTHCASPAGDEDAAGSGASRNAGDPKDPSDKATDVRGALAAVRAATRMKRGADLQADARTYATRVAANAGVASPVWDDVTVSTGGDGLSHVRLRQKHQGLKVWGADVVVHANAAELTSLAGSLAVHVDALDPAKTMAEGVALAKAKRDQYGTQQPVTTRESVEPIVFVDADGVAHTALHVEFYNEFEGNVRGGLWSYVYDAKTEERLARWNAIDTLSQASGEGGNDKHSHAWNGELDVEPQGSGYVMTTSRLRTIDMRNAQSGAGVEVTGSSLTGWNDAAINDAHGYAEITLNLLSEWMGHDSIDDAGFKIVSRVHYGRNYENAFWNGSQMTYGDGASTFHALSGALDVVAHEIHHGFTTKHSNLAYSGEPGGLNEGFSDIAGKTAEFYYRDFGANFDVGRDIFKRDGALRYMCDPTRDGHSIDHASKMTPSLDPHYSSGVPNKFFCRLAKRFSDGSPEGTATREGVRKAATPVYLANAQYWTSSTSFVQGCQGTVDAARALDYAEEDVEAIKASWADVGVYCDGAAAPPPPCDEVLTGETGTLTSPNYPEAYGNGFAKTWCIDAAEGQQVHVSFDAFETESGYDYVTLGDKTGAQLSKTAGSSPPAPVSSSRIYVTFKTDSSVTKKGWRARWTSR